MVNDNAVWAAEKAACRKCHFFWFSTSWGITLSYQCRDDGFDKIDLTHDVVGDLRDVEIAIIVSNHTKGGFEISVQ